MRLLLPILATILIVASPLVAPAQVVPTRYQQDAVGEASPASPTLSPPNRADREEGARKPGGLPSPVTVFGSLALVLGVFFVVVWLLRRTSPGGTRVLPAEAFEVLGRAPLANQQHVRLVRCGTRLLLIAVGPTGTETLSEITDADEVDHLIGLCRQSRSIGGKAGSRQALRYKEG